jgi:hypothetical protein
VEALYERRTIIRKLIGELRSSSRNRFPNWQDSPPRIDVPAVKCPEGAQIRQDGKPHGSLCHLGTESRGQDRLADFITDMNDVPLELPHISSSWLIAWRGCLPTPLDLAIDPQAQVGERRSHSRRGRRSCGWLQRFFLGHSNNWQGHPFSFSVVSYSDAP